MELYGDGLGRIFAALAAAGSKVAPVRDALLDDGVVASLLLIHGLFPVELETRVLAALDSVRPYMESHGGNVELVGIVNGVAHLRLKGSCDGCPASASTMELAIMQALEEAAPDLLGTEVEGIVETKQAPVGIGNPLPMVNPNQPDQNGGPGKSAWMVVEDAAGLPSGAMTSTLIDGTQLFVANVAGTLLAYRNKCPGCGSSLEDGSLEGGLLTCASCERRYELPLAGRMVGHEPLQLAPVPLLADNGSVRVALGA